MNQDDETNMQDEVDLQCKQRVKGDNDVDSNLENDVDNQCKDGMEAKCEVEANFWVKGECEVEANDKGHDEVEVEVESQIELEGDYLDDNDDSIGDKFVHEVLTMQKNYLMSMLIIIKIIQFTTIYGKLMLKQKLHLVRQIQAEIRNKGMMRLKVWDVMKKVI